MLGEAVVKMTLFMAAVVFTIVLLPVIIWTLTGDGDE